MQKRQVLLIRILPLFAEGIELILQKLEEVEVICLDCVDAAELEGCLKELQPAMVVLAGEKEDERAERLISYLLHRFEGIPVVWAELETNRMRFYTSHSFSATSSELFHALRDQENRTIEIHTAGKTKDQGD